MIDDQKQRAKWDEVLADLERRREQLHQLPVGEPWRVVIAGMITGASLVAAGAAFTVVLAHMCH